MLTLDPSRPPVTATFYYASPNAVKLSWEAY